MENLRKPDLILVDGGLQQINAANEIITDLGLNIPIAGLVKDDKHNTNTLMNQDLHKIEIDKTSNVFHLITRIQDEAHRFAVNFHKQVRSKGVFNTILDEIDGIGDVTKTKLLKKYKTVKFIKLASEDELIELGINKTARENLIRKLKEI